MRTSVDNGDTPRMIGNAFGWAVGLVAYGLMAWPLLEHLLSLA